jgi:formamidopyrimidine-DNA glycosylase
MPELPEVAALASALENEAKGKHLFQVLTKEAGGGPREGLYDDLVFGGADEQEVHRVMEGRVLTSVGRKGKHLWMELSLPSSSSSSAASTAASRGGKGKPGGGKSAASAASSTSSTPQEDKRFVLFHMGMTGSLLFQHVAIPQYRSFALDASKGWPPKFCKAQFIFANNEGGREGGKEEEAIRLAFCDQRRWGRVQLLPAGVEDPRTEAPLKELAPDAWKQRPSLEVFGGKLKETDIAIKAALLDQGRVVCGLGNWVCDEVLFQAKVDPAKKSKALTEEEVRRVWESVEYVCATACAANARSEEFPPGWLFHCRWAKTKKEKAGVKGPEGRVIVFETVGGRTTAIVPSVQRAKKGGGEVEKEGGAGGGEEGAGGGKGNGNKQVKKEVGVEEVTTKKTGKGKKRVNEEEKAEQAGVGQEGREAATTTTIPKWATKKLKTEEDAGKNMRATKKTMTARRSSPRGGSGEAGGVKTKGKGAKKGK